jgi:uncharacterized protein (TIGR02391 family)
MLDEKKIMLLQEIFVGSTASNTNLNAIKFRAEHCKYIDLIDELVSSRLIDDRDGNYTLRLTTLPEIIDTTPQVQDLIKFCEQLFSTLKKIYLSKPGHSVLLSDLSNSADLPDVITRACIPYFSDALLINGYSTDLLGNVTNLTPAEKLLKHESFINVVEEIQSWPKTSISTQKKFTPLSTIFPRLGNELAFEQLLHPAILEHALPQYKDGHLRDSVLNSITAVYDLIRQKTGLADDGEKLIGKAFSIETPYLILSELNTESGQSDQKGFMQIFNGAYKGIRNPKAHSLFHDLTEIEAAQYLVFASLLARRVEEAEVITR